VKYRSWSYWLKSLYRKEPLLAIALTVGVMDVLVGTVDGSSTLAIFGLAAGGGALALAFWKSQRPRPNLPTSQSTLYLPEQSSRPQVPIQLQRRTPPPSP
jgi:hypothetical protein